MRLKLRPFFLQRTSLRERKQTVEWEKKTSGSYFWKRFGPRIKTKQEHNKK